MANKQRNTRVVTVGDTAKIENDLRKLNIGPLNFVDALGAPRDASGRAKKQKL